MRKKEEGGPRSLPAQVATTRCGRGHLGGGVPSPESAVEIAKRSNNDGEKERVKASFHLPLVNGRREAVS